MGYPPPVLRRLGPCLLVLLSGCARACASRPPFAPEVELWAVPTAPVRSPEAEIARPLERHLAKLPAVRHVVTFSGGRAVVARVEFAPGTDVLSARMAVSQSMGEIPAPEGTSFELAPRLAGSRPTLRYTLESGRLSAIELRRLQDWTLERRMLRVPGVTSVASCGGAREEVQVTLDAARLAEHGLFPHEAADAIERALAAVGGGDGAGGFVVRQSGLTRLEDLGPLPLRGTELRLSDVAQIALGPAAADCLAFRDGAEVVAGAIYVYDGDAATARRALDAASGELPPGVAIRIVAPTAEVELAIPGAQGGEVRGVAKGIGLAVKRAATVTGSVLEVPIAGGTADRAGLTVEGAGADGEAVLAAAETIPGVGWAGGGATAIRLAGRDFAELSRIAAEVGQAATAVAGVRAVAAVGLTRRPELRVEPEREALARLGVPAEELHAAVRLLVRGREVGFLVRGEERVPIRVRLPQEGANPTAIAGMLLRTTSGSAVPLASVAQVRAAEPREHVMRVDGERVAEVLVRIAPADRERVIAELRAKLAAEVKIPQGLVLTIGVEPIALPSRVGGEW